MERRRGCAGRRLHGRHLRPTWRLPEPRPKGWTKTSVGEQADDAAALLRALDLAPAMVCGNSSGAMFVNELLLRHPELVQAAFMHEPPYVAVSSDPAQVVAGLQALVEAGMAAGGPAATMDLFLRYVAPDEVIDSLDPELLDRMLGNGEVFFTVELPGQSDYLPDEGRLPEVTVPCLVTAGIDNRDPTSPIHYLYESPRWLAERLGTRLVELPGGHVPQLTHPRDYVEALRPTLDRFR